MKKALIILFTILQFYCFGQKLDTVQNKPGATKSPLEEYLIHNQNKMMGKDFPDFIGILNGMKYTNDDLNGKVVLINFWFSTCHPCALEYKALNNIYEEFASNSKFELIAFTLEKPESIQRAKQKHDLKYKIVSLSEEQCRILMNNNGFPTNILLDKSGKIKYWKSGGEVNEDSANLFFKKLSFQ